MKTIFIMMIYFLIAVNIFAQNKIIVPNDYSTIQEAINVAYEGDTVLVRPGTYHENIHFNGIPIILASQKLTTGDEQYTNLTIIDGDQNGSVVTFTSGEDTNTVMCGFTIRNGQSQFGGGILLSNGSSPRISDVVIENNKAYIDNYTTSHGGGILIRNNSYPVIKNSTIRNNNCLFGYGAGIGVRDAKVELENVILDNNNYSENGHVCKGGSIGSENAVIKINDVTIKNSESDKGGAIYTDNSTLKITNSIIANCISGVNAPATFNNSSIEIDSLSIKNCIGENGGGLRFNQGDCIINNAIIKSNVSGFFDGGGAISSLNASMSIKNSIIVNNESGLGSGAVWTKDGNLDLKATTISNNISKDGDNGGAGGIFINGTNSSIYNCTIANNLSQNDSKASGIYINATNNLDIKNSIIAYNSGENTHGIYNKEGSVNISYSNIHNNENSNFYNCGENIGLIETTNLNGDSCDIFFNIFIEPQFVDPNNENYKLSPSSPCIDAGDPDFPLNPDGTTIDIGAYYFNQGIIDTTSPVAPELLNAVYNNNKIHLTWSVNDEIDFAKYKIYRNMNQSATMLIDSVEGNPFDTSYTDTNIEIGEEYFYRITAVDSSLNESSFSNQLSVITNNNEIPFEEVNPNEFEFDLSLTGNIYFNNQIGEDTNDAVAAFVNGEVRGFAQPVYQESTGEYLFGMTIYSNQAQGENITFKAYDASEDSIYRFTKEEITFNADDITGSINEPFEIHAVSPKSTNLTLNQNWNWFSLNYTDIQSDMSLSNVLTTLNSSASFIKDRDHFAEYSEQYGWQSFNGLDTVSSKTMYMIKMNNPDTLNFTGFPVKYQSTPINLTTGWNWVGYLPQSPYQIDSALTSITGSGGFIKNQVSFAEYVEGEGWVSLNGLENLKPFDGYKIKMESEDTLLYSEPPSEKAVTTSKPLVQTINAPWNIELNKYIGTMALTASLPESSQIEIDSGDVIGAFTDEECRGITTPVKPRSEDTYLIGMLIYGEEETPVSFKYFDSETGDTYEISGKIAFKQDEVIGGLKEPYELNLTPTKVKEDNLPNDYSLSQNYPNPFNPSTNIKFTLPKQSSVKLEIYNLLGEVVKTIINKPMQAGYHRVEVNLNKFSSGIYFYSIKAAEYENVKKMMLVK